MKKINMEFFAPPIGLESILAFNSVKLYTSDNLKKNYVLSMSKSDRLNEVSNKVLKMVEKNIIIPCFLTKGIISTILFKMHFMDRIRTPEDYFREEFRKVFGFYEADAGKIYVLISNSINKFGFTNDDLIASITAHEAAHMFANKKQKLFLSTFKEEIRSFYNNYFSELFNLIGNFGKEVDNIITFIFSNFENAKKFDNKNLVIYYKKLDVLLRKYSSLETETFTKLITDLIVTLKIFINSTSVFIKNMEKFRHILSPLDNAYQSTFGSRPTGNIAVQELMLPSEIISVLTEVKGNQSIIKKIFANI